MSDTQADATKDAIAILEVQQRATGTPIGSQVAFDILGRARHRLEDQDRAYLTGRDLVSK